MAFDSEDLTSHHPACRALAIKWRMPVELALDLVALALYDIVIYADDSTSMKYAESGARIDDMKVILERVTEVATLFDHDGMSITAFDCLACTPACMYTSANTTALQQPELGPMLAASVLTITCTLHNFIRESLVCIMCAACQLHN